MKYVFKSILWRGKLRSQRAKSLLSHQKSIIKTPAGIIVSSNKNPTGNISGKKNSQYLRFYYGGKIYWPWMWTENNLKDWCLCNHHSSDKLSQKSGRFVNNLNTLDNRVCPSQEWTIINSYSSPENLWDNSIKGWFLGSCQWMAVAMRRKDEYQVNTWFLCVST